MKPFETLVSLGRIDEEVIGLCRAINALPGLHTVESCCGHGRSQFEIWFQVEECEQRGLFILARSVNRRYFKYGSRWLITVDVSDIPEKPLPIDYLLSCADRGEKAYKQALALVGNINFYLHHEAFLKGYNLL